MRVWKGVLSSVLVFTSASRLGVLRWISLEGERHCVEAGALIEEVLYSVMQGVRERGTVNQAERCKRGEG